MSRSTPSLVALLGLVAVAGYKNRNRISEMLADARENAPASARGESQEQTGFLSEVGQRLQSRLSGGGLAAALSDLKDRFAKSGLAATADSWISSEANRPVDVRELEATLGDETLEELQRKTGFSRQDLLLRLNGALPDVVNRMTPQGRIPTDDEAQSLT